jgi:hypothetical protein
MIYGKREQRTERWQEIAESGNGRKGEKPEK